MPLPVRLGSSCAALAIALATAGCSPLGMVVGAGATVGLASAQERGVGGTLSDTRIRADINEKWLQHSLEMIQKLDLTIVEGRVLLTGTVPKAEMRVDAVRLTWQVPGVREVINEIRIGDGGGTVDYARDVWISTQLRSAILFDRGVQAVNYSVETVDGVVYLMGVAQSQTELDRVTNHARNLRYVQRVVSYVRMKDQPAGVAADPPRTGT